MTSLAPSAIVDLDDGAIVIEFDHPSIELIVYPHEAFNVGTWLDSETGEELRTIRAARA
jgi:hypothetical protein